MIASFMRPPHRTSASWATCRVTFAALAFCAFAATALWGAALNAQQSAPPDRSGFLTRLGSDTIAIEGVTTYSDSIVGEFVTRSPTTARYVYVARLGPDHEITSYVIDHFRELTGPAIAVHLTYEVHGDSAHVVVQRGDSAKTFTVAAPRGTIPLAEPAFGLHQVAIARALANRGQRVPTAWVYLPDELDTGSVLRGPRDDTVRITTATDTIRAVVDGQGHVLAMTDPGGTLQAAVVRTDWPDLPRWAAEFAARDARHQGLGVLSPRDTLRAKVGDANILVDYGRPTKRGRQIFGAIVPWNTVWRTGANAATTLVLDKNVVIGDTHVAPGTYTLFSIPARTGWTLIVSRKTGEWGTEYDPSADLARIPMQVTTLKRAVERFTIGVEPAGEGDAELTLAWDTRMGRVALRANSSAVSN